MASDAINSGKTLPFLEGDWKRLQGCNHNKTLRVCFESIAHPAEELGAATSRRDGAEASSSSARDTASLGTEPRHCTRKSLCPFRGLLVRFLLVIPQCLLHDSTELRHNKPLRGHPASLPREHSCGLGVLPRQKGTSNELFGWHREQLTVNLLWLCVWGRYSALPSQVRVPLPFNGDEQESCELPAHRGHPHGREGISVPLKVNLETLRKQRPAQNPRIVPESARTLCAVEEGGNKGHCRPPGANTVPV